MARPTTTSIARLSATVLRLSRAEIIQGQLNTPLNDTGRAQARKLGQHLRRIVGNIDACHSSDLSRASEVCRPSPSLTDCQTASIALGELRSSVEVAHDERLRERVSPNGARRTLIRRASTSDLYRASRGHARSIRTTSKRRVPTVPAC